MRSNTKIDRPEMLSFIHFLNDALIILGKGDRIEMINEQACRLLQLDTEIVTGKNFLDVISLFLAPLPLEIYNSFYIKDASFIFSGEYLSGTRKKNKNYHVRIHPIYNHKILSGNSILFLEIKEEEINKSTREASGELKINNSIYAQKIEKDREVYNNTSKQFKNLAQNSPDIIYIIDVKNRKVIYFNREVIFDYPCHELERSEGWIEMVHPEDIKSVKAHWSKFINAGKDSDNIEYRLKRKTEEYEWVVNRHMVMERDPEGLPLLVLLNITIITERKRAEEALRESEARLLALIDNTTDIIWSVDKNLQLTALNTSFKTHFKAEFRMELEVGDSLLQVLPLRISTEWLQNHRRALGGERFSTEFIMSSKKRNYSYEISYNPIYSPEGGINGVSVFGRDITQRKLSENDIIRTNFELDSFVYRASHDLRAPLRSVLGLINIVKTEENAQQRSHYLNLVDKSINKLDTFISDLTNFSRNSRLEVKIEKIDFNSIIDESVENLRYMENSGLLEIKKEIDDSLEFYSDPVRISIILQNILSNSIKYRNTKIQKPFVNIKAIVTKSYCTIAIEDNGKGIKGEYVDKIFNMFFRASYDSYGSGLGLYITKQVVEKLKGEISVNSTLGSGSVFEIRLPNLVRECENG